MHTKIRKDDPFTQLFNEVTIAAVMEEAPDVDLCLSIAKKQRELSATIWFGYNYAREAAVKCLAVLAQEVERYRSE